MLLWWQEESSWLVNKDKTELQQELRKAMEWMKYDMRQAGDISIDVDADGVWQEASISYFKPQGVSNGVIDWGTTNPGPVQFFLDGDTEDFCRLYDGNKKLIARNITHVQFRRLDTSSDILEVELTGQKTTIKGNVIDDSLDFKIKLRN